MRACWTRRYKPKTIENSLNMVKMFVGFIRERGLIAENLELLISEFLKSREADLRDGKIQDST